jgi:hypothetical protein
MAGTGHVVFASFTRIVPLAFRQASAFDLPSTDVQQERQMT